MSSLFDLSGKVAVVTGSSKGIGKAIALRMAEHGARVVISSRKADACEPVAAAINRRYSASETSFGTARQVCSKPGKFHKFGKSRHCCGFTGCTAQFAPSRKTHSPFGLSSSASPRRSARNRVNCWINSCSLTPRCAASRVISASVSRTCPGQRQQAVQRWHSWKIGTRAA